MSDGPDRRHGSVPPKVAELAELGVLTASLLHEVRQPLFAVKGRLQLALRAGTTPSQAELGELVQQLAHLEELLDHYAGLGRPDDSWEDLDLVEAIARAVRMVASRAQRTGAVVAVEADEPVVVRGRAVAMRQIVLNLLANAVDAVAGRERRQVRIRAVRDGRIARLEVIDTGPGLPDEIAARLFQAFVTTKPVGRGTGLGLYIARKLVEEASGTIRVERPDEGGTRMIVEFPA